MKLSSGPLSRWWCPAWNCWRYRCRSDSVRVSAIWAICRISGVQRRSDSTNWRRVRPPGVCRRKRCSWVACTGPYTTGRAPHPSRVAPSTRAVDRHSPLPANPTPARHMRRPGLIRLAALAAALVLVAVTVLRGQPVHAADHPLRYLGGAVGSLDPARIGDAGDVELLLQLYAGLTRLDEQGNVYPSLASSWEVSPDGTTYTFHLRPNLHFSDGSALDANDVRRSWLRLLDPSVHATAPDVLNIVSGATERLAGGSESEVGVTAPNARTLVVHLRHPAGYFTAITATPTTFVVPRSALPSGDWQTADHFIGSGPYVADAMNGTTLKLTANHEYAGTAPPISEVDWVTDVTGDPVTAYSNNELDLVQVAPSDATWIGYDPTLGRGLHRAASLSLEYLGFDTTRPPFDDMRVRRAFSLALDRSRLVELADGEAASPANSVVPPAIQPGGLPAVPNADLAEAKRLLDEAGYADRSKLGTIVVDGTGLDVT